MDDIIKKIQMVINTLDGGFNDLPTTYKNCATLKACIDFLCEARDMLAKKEEEKKNGNDHAE